jgi:hypothetical protein
VARRVVPPVSTDEPKFKRKATVTRTATQTTRTNIEIVPDDPDQPTQEGNVRIFLDQALTRFNQAVDAETYNRTQGMIDTLMVDGDGQWDDDIRGRRMRKKRPCLTINRFKPMIAHVSNEQRMSRPAIQIDPVGDGADKDSAQIRQGLIRHIEIESSAETVYDNAFERMIEKGWSWFRIVTDFESEKSHNQVIKIEGFTNDFCVYGDPNAEQPTRKDMKWAFIVYDMPRGEYLTLHPKSQAAGLTNFSSIGDQAPGWITSDSIRVAEYYYIRETAAVSVRLMGGDGIWEDEIEERVGLWYKKAELAAMDANQMAPEAVQPVPVQKDKNGQLITRKSFKCKPMWAKINAVEILDGDKGDDFKLNTAGREIPGKYIPLIMVSGRERMIKGQRRLEGMVRANRDVQRMYNYLASGFVEMVALAPKAPYIVAWSQLGDFKPIWDKLNEENWPYLPYLEKDKGGQLLPPPQRQDNRIAESAAGYLQGLAQFDNMLKQGFNIYDPSLGTAKADQSGRAIAGLQGRSDAANMNWMDNSRRATVFAGEVILEMIPEVYDAKRTITIDRASKKDQVIINEEFVGPDGMMKVNRDMSTGKYSVTVSLGQYASKREQAVQSLTDISKNVPQVALALLPLILGQMDTPLADEAADIVRRMQPPQMQEPGSPEQMQSQFQAMMQQHAQLVKALTRANDLIDKKLLDQASKERIAAITAQAQVVGFTMKANSAAGLQMATQDFQRLTQALDQDHDRILAQHTAAKEIVLQQMQNDGAVQQQQAAPEPAGVGA